MVIPLTHEEVKRLLKEKQDEGEAQAIKYLAEEAPEQSVASRIYKAWQLDRQFIKECHIAMSHERALQVTFNNLIGATRFKKLEGSRLVKTRCQRQGCGQQDSWEHFQTCYEIPPINTLKRKEKIEFLVNLCNKIQSSNPIRPETWEGGVGQEGDQQQIQ